MGAVGLSAKCQSRHFAPQQIASLFDHLVGGDEQASRRRQTEGFSRFEIEGGLVPRRSLYRQVGRLGTAEDLINVIRCLSIVVSSDNPAGHKTARLDMILNAMSSGRSWRISMCS